METKIYKVPFYLIEKGYNGYYKCMCKGIVLVKKSDDLGFQELVTGFDKFYNCTDLYKVFGGSYQLKDETSGIKDDIQTNNFAFSLEIEDFTDSNIATFFSIEDYERDFDKTAFYNYYKKLKFFNSEEKQKVKERNI